MGSPLPRAVAVLAGTERRRAVSVRLARPSGAHRESRGVVHDAAVERASARGHGSREAARRPAPRGRPRAFSAGTRASSSMLSRAHSGASGIVRGGGCTNGPRARASRARARAVRPARGPRFAFRGEEPGRQPRGRHESCRRSGRPRCSAGRAAPASGATFGDVFSRERRGPCAVPRGGAHAGSRYAPKAVSAVSEQTPPQLGEIERLEAAVAELASEVRAFRAGKAETKKKRRNEETKETKKNGDARAARDDDSAEDDDLDDDLDENASGDVKLRKRDPVGRDVAREFVAKSRRARQKPPRGGSVETRLADPRGDPRREGRVVPVGSGGRNRDEPRRFTRKKSVEAAADPARALSGPRGRYLRTTRRDAEAARYARGLKAHSGSPASEFWGEGRGAVQGGGAVGGGIEGADEGGVEDADLEETREREEISRRIANRRNKATKETDARAVSDGFAGDSRIGESRAEDAAAAAFAAALSAVDARRAARPDPAVTIARLTERNRALRRELGVAQRLMTGYHAQLMTGGAAFTFTELTEPTEVEAQSRNAPFGARRERRRPRTRRGDSRGGRSKHRVLFRVRVCSSRAARASRSRPCVRRAARRASGPPRSSRFARRARVRRNRRRGGRGGRARRRGRARD